VLAEGEAERDDLAAERSGGRRDERGEERGEERRGVRREER